MLDLRVLQTSNGRGKGGMMMTGGKAGMMIGSSKGKGGKGGMMMGSSKGSKEGKKAKGNKKGSKKGKKAKGNKGMMMKGMKGNKAKKGQGKQPTLAPANALTRAPTRAPTRSPTRSPTRAPTRAPTQAPTQAPTRAPSNSPTILQSGSTRVPTSPPTLALTSAPTTVATNPPTSVPTSPPTISPNDTPSPTEVPTSAPTFIPTFPPTDPPTGATVNTGVSISAFVAGNPDTSILFDALERAAFVEALAGPGNFTLFAPTNTGFGLIPTEVVDLLFTNDEFIPHLQNLLLYHLLPGERFQDTLPAEQIITTFNFERVRILQNPFRVNDIMIASPDNDNSNGVTHSIDGVLAPSWVFNSLASRVFNDPDLTILLEFLVLTGLGDALNVFGEEFTLLAPTDDAFNALGADVLAELRDPENVAALATIIAYHVVVGVVTLAEFDASPGEFLTAEGRFVTYDAAARLFNNAGFISTDILANNGVLFKINAVLEFPNNRLVAPTLAPTAAPIVAVEATESIMGIIRATSDLLILETAVILAGLNEVLDQNGPFTLFAPSDAAFDLLPASFQELLFENSDFLPHLQDFLLHHVVQGEFKRLDFQDNRELPSLNTETLTIQQVPLRVGGVRVTEANLDAVNGVVHVLSEALTPSWVTQSLSSLVEDNSKLSILYSLMELVGFQLPKPGAYTLLAPINAAFQAVPQITLDGLISNPDELTRVLRSHVLIGVWTKAELTTGEYESLSGSTVSIQARPTPIRVEEVELATFGYLANNGILFKISEVLPFIIGR